MNPSIAQMKEERRPCDHCMGQGGVEYRTPKGYETHKCPNCSGRGYVYVVTLTDQAGMTFKKMGPATITYEPPRKKHAMHPSFIEMEEDNFWEDIATSTKGPMFGTPVTFTKSNPKKQQIIPSALLKDLEKGLKNIEAKKERKSKVSTSEQIAKSVTEMTNRLVQESLDRVDQSFDSMREEIEKKVNDMFVSRPVLSVSINDGPIQRITSRASKILPRLIANAKLKLNTLMIGPAGCGKTTAAHQLAESLGVQFGSVCLTAGASETWLFGRQTPNGFVEGMFSKIYREGGVFLADEMDAADANLLLSINTALSHDTMLNPMSGEVIQKHPDFTFIGAGNTNGKGANHMYTGRSRLDAATLDRFVIVMTEYDHDLEQQLCPAEILFKWLQETRLKLKENGYDEFISTRAFRSTYIQAEAGIPYAEIKDSLIANWGAASKDVANKMFEKHVANAKQEEASYSRLREELDAHAAAYLSTEKVKWTHISREG